ncbi:MAG: hypothetical protein ACRCU2_07510 [Planktothrix sp.]
MDKLAVYYYSLVKNGNHKALSDYLRIIELRAKIDNTKIKEERDKYQRLTSELYKLVGYLYKVVFTEETLGAVRDGFKTESESLAIDILIAGKIDPSNFSIAKLGANDKPMNR